MPSSIPILYMDAKSGDSMTSTKQLNFKKKAIRLITFSPKDAHSSPLFKEISVVKLEDQIEMNK